MSLDYDVAIIGAGAAGIGAAGVLCGASLTCVMLEASGRVGGRAWTQELAGYPIELGCGYLHSGDRNPWTSIAEDSGFDVDRRAPAWRFPSLGFPERDSVAADEAFSAWESRLRLVAADSDCAADAVIAAQSFNAPRRSS